MIKGRMNRFLVIFAIFILSACASLQNKKHAESTQILYSPTGDPLNGGLLGRPACPDAMKHWFDRVDTKHDSAITQDEFLNDAKMQFQRMDIDKNGYLVSEEVERFRMTYRDYPAGEKLPASSGDQQEQQPSGGRQSRGHGGGEGSGGVGNSPGEGSVIDPVMSADTNLDYKVTPDEFMAYSRKVFEHLDADHNGKLSLTEVTVPLCGPKP